MSFDKINSNNKMSVRVALASKNGERVDQHFAKSENFSIYEIENDVPTFIEIRSNNVRNCFCNDDNERQIFESILDLISDCQFVVAQRIGHGAISYLVDRGIRAAQIDDTIENALKSIVSSGKLRHLFRR